MPYLLKPLIYVTVFVSLEYSTEYQLMMTPMSFRVSPPRVRRFILKITVQDLFSSIYTSLILDHLDLLIFVDSESQCIHFPHVAIAAIGRELLVRPAEHWRSPRSGLALEELA